MDSISTSCDSIETPSKPIYCVWPYYVVSKDMLILFSCLLRYPLVIASQLLPQSSFLGSHISWGKLGMPSSGKSTHTHTSLKQDIWQIHFIVNTECSSTLLLYLINAVYAVDFCTLVTLIYFIYLFMMTILAEDPALESPLDELYIVFLFLITKALVLYVINKSYISLLFQQQKNYKIL